MPMEAKVLEPASAEIGAVGDGRSLYDRVKVVPCWSWPYLVGSDTTRSILPRIADGI